MACSCPREVRSAPRSNNRHLNADRADTDGWAIGVDTRLQSSRWSSSRKPQCRRQAASLTPRAPGIQRSATAVPGSNQPTVELCCRLSGAELTGYGCRVFFRSHGSPPARAARHQLKRNGGDADHFRGVNKASTKRADQSIHPPSRDDGRESLAQDVAWAQRWRRSVADCAAGRSRDCSAAPAQGEAHITAGAKSLFRQRIHQLRLVD